ncbi:MAG: putative photosynthetic complex assembly protein PuhE [Pseudomonadota bacterium]
MTSPAVIAALIALFTWWFFTGAILLAIRHSERAGGSARLSCTLWALPLLLAGTGGFWVSLTLTTPGAAIVAFLSALLIWGWIELAFLAGMITGPNLRECPDNLPGWERFVRAWGTVAYHEMLLLLVMVVMLLLAHNAPNPFGAWVFATLYGARVSAKLNLFLGVPRINLEFIPQVLGHLASHFRIARLNWLFPISVTFLTVMTVIWWMKLSTADTAQAAAGYALLTALTALALLEHWLMVLPLPDAKLWRWMLPAPPKKTNVARPEVPHAL